jgi:hypothetical protein
VSTIVLYAATAGAEVACFASTGDMAAQSAEMCALIEEAAEIMQDDGGVRLTFEADTSLRDRLVAWIERERRCCAFLGYELTEADGTLMLQITGGPEAEVWWRAISERSGD